jgi:hypothetical protein
MALLTSGQPSTTNSNLELAINARVNSEVQLKLARQVAGDVHAV